MSVMDKWAFPDVTGLSQNCSLNVIIKTMKVGSRAVLIFITRETMHKHVCVLCCCMLPSLSMVFLTYDFAFGHEGLSQNNL